MKKLIDLKVRIFFDGADLDTIKIMSQDPLIAGFTTNPTLMRSAGVENYRSFALSALDIIKNKPISFEVFSDDFAEMKDQAMEIASWAENVYVKIPITNTKGESSADLISKLSKAGVRVNVTAVFTIAQVKHIIPALKHSCRSSISIFAGRIADTGISPISIMQNALRLVKSSGLPIDIIWASPREVLNVIEADQIGCHVITVTKALIEKFQNIGKKLELFSLETVEMFYRDATIAQYSIAAAQLDQGALKHASPRALSVL